jgi:hypothetical protein
MKRKSMLLAVLMLLVASVATGADYCIRTGGGNDFDLEITALSGSYINMTLLARSVTRAAYGSAVTQGNNLYLGFTKNTTTCTVAYQGILSVSSLTGPGQAHVFCSDPFSSSIREATWSIDVGSCGFDEADSQDLDGE